MNIYQNTFKTVKGESINLADFQDKVLLVVNTASQCGWTWQYGELENLYQKYKSSGLMVLAFPSNNFGNQEPGSNEQINQFCSNDYNISFPVMEKTVIIGDNQNPLYFLLTRATGETPHWNFNKFLIGKNNSSVKFFDQNVNPMDESFTSQIETLLA